VNSSIDSIYLKFLHFHPRICFVVNRRDRHHSIGYRAIGRLTEACGHFIAGLAQAVQMRGPHDNSALWGQHCLPNVPDSGFVMLPDIRDHSDRRQRPTNSIPTSSRSLPMDGCSSSGTKARFSPVQA
jgi:hypothetical protein